MSTQDAMAERYGAPSPARRRALVIATVGIALVFLGWLAWTVAGHTQTEVTSEMEGFSVIDDSTVSVVLVVSLDEEAEGASCRLRAFAEDHTTVGELAFAPDPGAGRRNVVEIRTDRRATAVESLGCTTDGQKQPR
ncbi:DUF4307 domain-containing protein [Nocardioides sp.]|uniref:DUF4307 domain-containing protein n=1 Tax=Nocardioides sp. TaxID=35761 RepID=UPI001A24BB75|nr:DUF4307 domain-containing protein [Nocardioides sp.]MBJ7356552.1 DUF4307 domain-containing protein [Nocardioides sp.]